MMFRNLLRSPALFCSLAAVVPLTLSAQSTTQGAISGTVFDATDAAIPKATVLIHNVGNGSDQTVTSSASGSFRAAQLEPGTYTVTISSAGFSTQKQTGVIVQVNEVTEVNPHLTTGETTTAVEVTAEVPVLKFESAEYGGHLDTHEIEAIPINNRRWSALALTTPAVTNSSDGFGLLSFRAISPLLNVVEIDGADDNQAFFAEERGRTRAGYSTSQAAVREFTVNTGVYGADFGRAVGGVVNTVTKSGGNQMHGEVYFYNRNSSRSAFVPGATNTVFNAATNTYVTSPYRPKDNRNQLGFGIGGPLIKDRLFWFYAFDEYRRNFPGTAKANSPGTFFVAPNAALSGNEACAYTPTSVTFTGTAGAVGPGATATTQTAADSAACTLAARLRYANFAAGANAYNTQLQALLPDLGSVPRFGNQNINTPKLDWQVNSRHHVSGIYHRLRWDSPGGVQTQGTNNYAIDTFGTDFVKLDYGVAKLDSLITNRITNEIRYQYGRELNNEGNQPTSAYTRSNLLNSTGFAPEVNLQGSSGNQGFYLGQPYYGFRVAYPDERKWQIGDTATFAFGRHNLRVGEDIVHNNDFQNFVNDVNGFYNYTATGPLGLANYFSDLLSKGRTCASTAAGVNTVNGLPCYNNLQQGFGPSIFEIQTLDYGVFAQDDWKLTPRLTLNLGVRYDYESFPGPIAAVANAALPQTANRPSDKNNVSPRLGFAFDPYGLGKTVVRGGFGFYYGRIPNNYILQTYTSTGAASAYTLATVIPTSTAPTLPNISSTAIAGTASAQFFAPNYQNPYAEQFDLAVQQNLGFANVLSLSYVGALGRELPNYINVNLDPTKAYTVNYTVTPVNGSCGATACGTYPVLTYGGRQQTNAAGTTSNNILLNPNFSSITESFSNINSNYHAFTVDVTNRSSKWAQFDVNYTWSHALDFSQNAATAPGTNNWLDPFSNQRLNYGNSNQNVKNRVVGWANLTAPGLAGHGPLTYLTNGWSIKPYIQIQNALPYSALFSGTAANQCTGVGCLIPASSGISGTGSTAYFPFIGRNTFQYPRTIEVDLRAQKSFTILENYSLEIFGESFNLANHKNFTSIPGTAYGISGTNLTPVSTFGSMNISDGATANTNYAYGPRVVQLGARVVF